MPRGRKGCLPITVAPQGRRPREREQFERIERKLDSIRRAVSKLEGKLMTKAEDIQAAVDDLSTQLDEATNEVAKDLQALRDELASGVEGGLTADEATALQARLDAKFGPVVARLQALGADPANPVPEVG